MDRNFRLPELPAKRGPYRRHSVEFKRTVVEQSLAPGASVAKVAQSHEVNANQVFAWRKLYREGKLGGKMDIALLPVNLIEEVALSDSASSHNKVEEIPAAVRMIRLEIGKARLIIEGKPDPEVLSLILKQALR
jgi:transposase